MRSQAGGQGIQASGGSTRNSTGSEIFKVELQGRGRFRRLARKAHRPVYLTSGVGELLEISSEDVVGKHLAEGVGSNRGKHGSRIAEAVRNESAGCSKLRLPTRGLRC